MRNRPGGHQQSLIPTTANSSPGFFTSGSSIGDANPKDATNKIARPTLGVETFMKTSAVKPEGHGPGDYRRSALSRGRARSIETDMSMTREATRKWNSEADQG
jgi:hypothetical protein